MLHYFRYSENRIKFEHSFGGGGAAALPKVFARFFRFAQIQNALPAQITLRASPAQNPTTALSEQAIERNMSNVFAASMTAEWTPPLESYGKNKAPLDAANHCLSILYRIGALLHVVKVELSFNIHRFDHDVHNVPASFFMLYVCIFDLLLH